MGLMQTGSFQNHLHHHPLLAECSLQQQLCQSAQFWIMATCSAKALSRTVCRSAEFAGSTFEVSAIGAASATSAMPATPRKMQLAEVGECGKGRTSGECPDIGVQPH